MAPSARPYMGATPFDGGVTFRVWTPFTSDVQVQGDFNNWNPDTPLFSEGNGYWSADLPGATVGQQYNYLITNAAWGSVLTHVDPYSRAFKMRGDPSLIAPSDTQYADTFYTTPAWNEMVIYELHIGTFVLEETLPRPGSTFDSAATKLDYLKDLGINAIEIMAAGEFESDTSWGYNPACIFAIEEQYGGPDGFRAFVQEGHKRGIAVIMDVVYNHLGYPAGDMWQFDEWSENGKGGIYFYNDWRSTTPWGDRRLITAGPRYGTIFSTMPGAGCNNGLRTGCDGMLRAGFAMFTATTTIQATTWRTDGHSCKRLMAKSSRASRGRLASPRICRAMNG